MSASHEGTPTPPRLLVCGLPPEIPGWLTSEMPGVEVNAVPDALDALRRLHTGRYQVLVLDQPLTPRAGAPVLAHLAGIPAEARPLLVCCTDSRIDPVTARSLVTEHGAARLLFHPLDPAEFVRQIAAVLQLETPGGRELLPGLADRTREAVGALWGRFQPAMRERAEEVVEASLALSNGELDARLRRRAEGNAHKLAGSLGTFGLPHGTRLAREAESLLSGTAQLAPEAILRLREVATSLLSLINSGPTPAGLPAGEAKVSRLLLVDGDPAFLSALSEAARGAGYAVDTADSLASARAALLRNRPAAAVIDLSLEKDIAAGFALLRALCAFSSPVPVIALTPNPVLPERVEAARLGARVFLQKPVQPQRVLAELSVVLQQARSSRPRVLTVDDDPHLLTTLRVLLEHEGFDVTSLTDPLSFWSTLESVDPDLLVLDVDMPSLSGVELCRVVRSDPRWCTLPVLFLTGQTAPSVVHRVFAAGADDFVAKPVVGPELVMRIRNRLERSTLLRSLSELDALTGIANRRRATELFEQLQRLAQRQQQPLCLVLLDLDDFKGINDRQGHDGGDRVLQAFAEHLQRSFRSEDVVGRWGGEEFVLGLFGSRRADAAHRVRRILADFSRQEFAGRDGRPFQVTASAGVAELSSDGSNLEELYRAADDALYRAKRAGRDRVEEALPIGTRDGVHGGLLQPAVHP